MRTVALGLVVVVLLGFGVSAQWPLVIETSGGTIEGYEAGGVNYYLGIPYAEPPLGDLRWRAPRSKSPWTGTRPASNYSSACLQSPTVIQSFTFPPNTTFSEDCLYLNVFAPNTATPSKSVVVWIHGGGLINGGNSEQRIRGQHMSLSGEVVVVSINYRLGVFGWLAHPAFTDDDPTLHSIGNYGFLDQQQALSWVQDNIESFGGNPKDVTIMGESAGATSVAWHLISPQSKGMFAKAVLQSPAAFSEAVYMEDAVAYAQGVQNIFNCTGTNHEIVRCLRALPGASLEAYQEQHPYPNAVVDGKVFVEHPYQSFLNNRFTAVPLIIGNVKDEGTIFIRSVPNPLNLTTYQQTVEKFFPSHFKQILKLYSCNDTNCWNVMADVIGDFGFVCSTKMIANALGDSGDTYSYIWAHEPSYRKNRTPNYGAFHSSEIVYVFSTLADIYTYLPTELDICSYMTKFWTTFAKTANPNDVGSNVWSPYKHPDNLSASFNDIVSVLQNYKEDACEFWWSYYAEAYPN